MIQNSKLSDYQLKKIIQCFCIDIPASKTALLLGFNRNTINHWYLIFRQVIYDYQTTLRVKLVGSVEVDESYFGAKRQRGYHGKRKRGLHLSSLYLGYLSAMAECIQKSCLTVKSGHYRQLYLVRCHCKA